MTTQTIIPSEERLPDFYDERVQAIYAILCDTSPPPDGEHWEGFCARRIVARTSSAVPAVKWGDAETVGNLIAQLQTFDPATPIYGVFHADAGDGRKARIRGLTLSRERVNGRLIDTGNVLVPYAIVAWSAPDERPSTEPSEEMVEALRPFADIANEYDDAEDDDFQVWKDFDVMGASLPLKHFRRARAALNESQSK